jgi:hypothetical protein
LIILRRGESARASDHLLHIRSHSLLRLGLLGSLESDNEGDGELELLGGFDDTLGDDVASHDTAD